MATTKNIIMKQFNGTDYDTLYPKTDVKQVENLTPSSIGAVAKTGDTMTGNLNIQKSSLPGISLKDATNGSSATIEHNNHRTYVRNFNSAGNVNTRRELQINDSGSSTIKDALLLVDFVDGAGTISNILHTGNLSDLGVARIVTGSYVGTGGYKESNPTTLSFDFVPKVVIFYKKDSGGVSAATSSRGGALLVNGVTKYYVSDYAGDSSYTKYITITWNENSVSWYGDDAEAQMNKSGIEYVYAALG